MWQGPRDSPRTRLLKPVHDVSPATPGGEGHSASAAGADTGPGRDHTATATADVDATTKEVREAQEEVGADASTSDTKDDSKSALDLVELQAPPSGTVDSTNRDSHGVGAKGPPAPGVNGTDDDGAAADDEAEGKDGQPVGPNLPQKPLTDREYSARLQEWVRSKRRKARQLSRQVEAQSRLHAEKVLRRMSSRRLKLDVGPPSPRKPLTGQRSFRSTTTALSSPRTVGEAKADAPAADVPGSPARRAAARSESKGGVSGTTTPKRGAVGKYHTRRGRQAQRRKAAGNKKQGSKRDGQRAATDLDEEAGPERRRFNAMRLADDGCVPVR